MAEASGRRSDESRSHSHFFRVLVDTQHPFTISSATFLFCFLFYFRPPTSRLSALLTQDKHTSFNPLETAMSDDIHEESKDWSKPGQENVHADISPEMSAPYLNSQHNKQALSDITDRRHVQGKMAQNNEVEFEFNYNDPFDALSPTVKHENKSGLVDPDDGKGHADMQPPDHESSAIHRDSIDSNSNIDDTLSSSHPDRVDPSYTWSCLSRRRPLPRAHAGA
jgi:hypothetical protein